MDDPLGPFGGFMHRTEFDEFVMEKLSEEMPNLVIDRSEDGQIIIHTGMAEDTDGEVIDFEDFENQEYIEEKEEEDEVPDED